MKQKIRYFVLLLALFAFNANTKAQLTQLITNGGFNATPINVNCTAPPTGWNCPGATVELANCCTNPSYGYWVDLTGCGYGNGKSISQQVPTVNGKVYLLEWELGCFNGHYYTNAGFDLEIGGATFPGTFYNQDFSAAPDHLSWKKGKFCFVANQSLTNIKFTGNGFSTGLTPATYTGFGLSYAHTGVIGLDNVSVLCLNDLFSINVVPGESCNKYCVSINAQQFSGVSYGSVKWYVDNVLEATGNSYCRVYPKNKTRIVKAEYSIITPCGIVQTATMQTAITATADCPCSLEGHALLNYGFTSCNTVTFGLAMDPGYKVHYAQWTLDGVSASGTNTGLTLSNLAPGQHTICAMLMGGVEGEVDNLCCLKLCQVITVPPPAAASIKTVTYCPLTDPQGPLYNPCTDCNGYYEYRENGQLVSTSNNGCGPFHLKPSSEVRCYQVLPGGYKCLMLTTSFNLQSKLIASAQPDETIYTPCNSASNLANYNVNCGGTYEITGPNGFYLSGISPAMVSLPTGDYNLVCSNLINCTQIYKTIHVLQKLMIMSGLPNETLTIPCASTTIAYNPNCGTDYEIHGPNGYFFQGNGQFPSLATLQAGDYTVYCIDMVNCITYSKNVHVEQLQMTMAQYPDETVYLACNSNTLTYDPNCASTYEIVGPNGYYFQSSTQIISIPILAAGDYSVWCTDYVNCVIYLKILHVLPGQYTETTCGVFIEMCEYNLDPDQSFYFVNTMTCDECKSVIQNHTSAGPWITQAYLPNVMSGPSRIVTREYIDANTCRKCTVTFTIANAQPYNYSLPAGQNCHEFELPACMHNTTVKMFVNGHPEDVADVVINGSKITLCCNNIYNIPNPQYVFYSETDPCCRFIVDLDCREAGQASPDSKEADAGTGTNLSDAFKLVPNPTSAVFRIVSVKENEQYSLVEIKNMDGKVVLSRNNIDTNTKIDAGKLARGTYFVNVYTAGGQVSLKLILTSE